jgi:predicted CXXCH cytochrome family protein
LNRLLKVASPDLCLACHKDIKNRMQGERVHPPAARDCLRCHAPHASVEKALLVRSSRMLCAECHKFDAAAFKSAHLDIDPAAMDCLRCHVPHSSKDAKLFKDGEHAPFAARSCEECHTVGGRQP